MRWQELIEKCFQKWPEKSHLGSFLNTSSTRPLLLGSMTCRSGLRQKKLLCLALFFKQAPQEFFLSSGKLGKPRFRAVLGNHGGCLWFPAGVSVSCVTLTTGSVSVLTCGSICNRHWHPCVPRGGQTAVSLHQARSFLPCVPSGDMSAACYVSGQAESCRS